MNNCLTNIALSLLLSAGGSVFAPPVQAQNIYCFSDCYPVWHEVCVVTPSGAECEGFWDIRCDDVCWIVP